MESRTLKERRREAEMGRDHTGHSLEIHQALRQEAFQRWLNRGGEHTVCQAHKSQSPELSRMGANDGEWRPPPPRGSVLPGVREPQEASTHSPPLPVPSALRPPQRLLLSSHGASV